MNIWKMRCFSNALTPRNVIVPIRFEYDCRDEVVKALNHPESHVTIGQYHDCRIPVNRPLTPSHFVDFIVRNFYHLAYDDFKDKVTLNNDVFPETIKPIEIKSFIWLFIFEFYSCTLDDENAGLRG